MLFCIRCLVIVNFTDILLHSQRNAHIRLLWWLVNSSELSLFFFFLTDLHSLSNSLRTIQINIAFIFIRVFNFDLFILSLLLEILRVLPLLNFILFLYQVVWGFNKTSRAYIGIWLITK